MSRSKADPSFRTIDTVVLVPAGFQNITSLSSAVGLTVPAGATRAWITVETKSVRWRDDGTAPTSSVGHLLGVGDAFEYDGDLSALKFIETAASAALMVSYYE